MASAPAKPIESGSSPAPGNELAGGYSKTDQRPCWRTRSRVPRPSAFERIESPASISPVNSTEANEKRPSPGPQKNGPLDLTIKRPGPASGSRVTGRTVTAPYANSSSGVSNAAASSMEYTKAELSPEQNSSKRPSPEKSASIIECMPLSSV